MRRQGGAGCWIKKPSARRTGAPTSWCWAALSWESHEPYHWAMLNWQN